MLELANALLERLDRGHAIAVATVTRINGSAPRTLGTAMAVDDEGAVIGSISGGCVEGAVYEACREVLETGVPMMQEFGYSDDDAFAVGLACGGRIEVIVQRLGVRGGAGSSGGAGASASANAGSGADASGGASASASASAGAGPGNRGGAGDESGFVGLTGGIGPGLRAEFEAVGAGRPAGVVLVTGGAAFGTLLAAGDEPSEISGLSTDAARRLLAELASRISAGRPGVAVVDCEDGPIEALFVVSSTQPRMIVFGAVDFSAALSNAAALLGYRVTICDARPVFATAERFPAASEVIVEWPAHYLARTEVDPRTAVVVLTHDDKFDVPLLEVALRLPVAYVGAMGSRRTHERRLDSLREVVGANELARLHSPIGLDIGASTPEETAVSILAEIVAARNAASGVRLTELEGPIHRPLVVHAVTGI